MSYKTYPPAKELLDYIDAYWVRKTQAGQSSGRRVYADGCADIIVNTGSTIAWFNPMARTGDSIPLHPGRMYLGGTMTEYGVVTAGAGCILTGIRFRPGAGGISFELKRNIHSRSSTLPAAHPTTPKRQHRSYNLSQAILGCLPTFLPL